MSLGLWVFLGMYFAAGGLIWYLYRRAKKSRHKNRNEPANDTETVDPADEVSEELLFTGLMLSDIYNDADSSDDMGADGFDAGDGGGFDGGDGGGFDGGDGGGFDF